MVFLHTLTTLSDFPLCPFFPTSELTEDQTSPPLINTQCLTATSGHVRRQLEKLSSSKSVCDSESYLQLESEAGEDTIEMEKTSCLIPLLEKLTKSKLTDYRPGRLQTACEEGDAKTRQSTSDQRWNIFTLCSLHTVYTQSIIYMLHSV